MKTFEEFANAAPVGFNRKPTGMLRNKVNWLTGAGDEEGESPLKDQNIQRNAGTLWEIVNSMALKPQVLRRMLAKLMVAYNKQYPPEEPSQM